MRPRKGSDKPVTKTVYQMVPDALTDTERALLLGLVDVDSMKVDDVQLVAAERLVGLGLARHSKAGRRLVAITELGQVRAAREYARTI